MAYHKNFTASYDRRGRVDNLNSGSYVNRPEYPLVDQYGFNDSPFAQRYYDPEGDSHAPRAPTWQDWDPYAAADAAYFFRAYGTSYDPMYRSRDGIQAPYWGMEYAEIPAVRNSYLSNWIGREIWRRGRYGQPSVGPNLSGPPILESQLPKPYILLLGSRGRMAVENRLVQIPAGALIIYITDPVRDRNGDLREYIEAVQVRSRPIFY